MVYGLVTEKVKHHQRKLQKLVSFRDFKNLIKCWEYKRQLENSAMACGWNVRVCTWQLLLLDFTTKYDIRWTYASKKDENEGKTCALYDTSLDESYQSKVSFFETI